MTIDLKRSGRRPRDGWVAFISRLVCLVILAVIAFTTLAPIGFRPATGHSGLERGAAFLLLGLALGVGFPRRLVLAGVFIVAIAGGLEVLQVLEASRHPRLSDMVVKIAGGIAGLALAALAAKALRRAGDARG